MVFGDLANVDPPLKKKGIQQELLVTKQSDVLSCQWKSRNQQAVLRSASEGSSMKAERFVSAEPS